jgi:hypothetical protein
MLLPLLIAVEAAVWVLAIRRGFAREKARSWLALLRSLPALRRWRREVQRTRVVNDRDLLPRLAAVIDSPVLAPQLMRALGPWLTRYKTVALFLLGARTATHSGRSRLRRRGPPDRGAPASR